MLKMTEILQATGHVDYPTTSQHSENTLKDSVTKTNSPLTESWTQNAQKVPWCVRIQPVGKRYKLGQPQLFVTFKNLQAAGVLSQAKYSDVAEWAEKTTSQLLSTSVVTNTQVQKSGFSFEVDKGLMVKECLREILQNHSSYGYHSNLHSYSMTPEGQVKEIKTKQKIVLEYSSPNIAKPFHAGHLRSTIIGNVLANLMKGQGHEVVRINYLGNWGTQFGLLAVGFQKYGNQHELEEDALQHMFKGGFGYLLCELQEEFVIRPSLLKIKQYVLIYVKINDESSVNTEIKNEAREFFSKMEEGDVEALSLWQRCMEKSIEEYTRMYKRLGVTFDRFDGEAMYVDKAKDLVSSLAENGLLKWESSGVGYIDLSMSGATVKDKYANLVRSDGATLYITRDIVAAVDRYEKYKFDRLLYVVENSQHSHFEQLVLSLQKAGHAWAERPLSDFHVKFGRVEGMSSRSGEVVFLRDILDEAKGRILATMIEKKSTKLSARSDMEDAAEKLAASAIIVQDLKKKRLQNYKFSWDQVLDFRGDTGISLQYTHARLKNIEVNSGMTVNPHCDLDLLSEPPALGLVQHLARYDEVIHNAANELEPCYLVQYMFNLSRLVHVASEELFVKDQPLPVSEARLLLFHCARLVLASGLKCLGVEPLDTF